MSEEDDKKRLDSTDIAGQSGNERPAGEDPLIELARIVHNNKQAGAPVSSGRVGSTDYFADLDEFAAPRQPEPVEAPVPQEPEFTAQPSIPEFTSAPAAPEPSFGRVDEPLPVSAPDTIESPVWPNDPKLDTIETTATEAFNRAPVPHVAASSANEPNYGDVGSSNLAPTVSIDLEQNLTAELEDELLGALRESVDTPVEEHVEPAAPVAPPVGQYHVSGLQTPATDYSSDFRDRGLPESGRSDPFAAAVQTPEPANSQPAFDISDLPAAPNLGATVEPGVSSSLVKPVEAERPAINEDDLFAALTTPGSDLGDGASSTGASDADKPIAGIDTLLADLDFPEREERQPSPVETPTPAEPSFATAADPAPLDTPTSADAGDIDDMVWPAAAAAVPNVSEDDAPPPPEGYDLDAVARAMQESDPSLKGSGVLPPHSAAEQAAVPHAEERSRRGLFVAGGVLGVAVLGAVGFFFMDGENVSVPDGPPPVISGLQEPLKIFPDEKAASSGGNQSAKLIYDRVDGTSENAPGQLARRENPEPVSLPPAPAGAQSGADLVPGATKRVRTVVVRPDGTIKTEDDAPAAPAITQPVPGPAEPRVVQTQPIVAGTEPAPAPVTAQPTVTQPAPTPVAPATPAIVATSEPQATTTEPATPIAPVPSVLPRKKPAAPVRVAQAPAAVTNPAPARTNNDGPLNLSQPAAAPASAASNTPTGGSIASGTYIVQVTSQRSAAAASDAYSGLQRRYPSILGSLNAVIVAADLGDRGTFYRARIPTGSRDEAVRLCEQLQGAGGDCFVRRQ